MKVLIFEDEIPAYNKLVTYVNNAITNVEILGWARSVKEAVVLINNHEDIDLIISDIELLDGNSFEVFENLKVECPIIFSTAYDQYLFKAFQTNGIAYLLKPYSESNFKEALEKYNVLFSSNHKINLDKNVIAELRNIIEGEKKTYKRRFSIKKKAGIKILNVEDIISFEASGDFSIAYDLEKQKHIINYSLGEIENKVDPAQFFRINRSEIINIDFIEKIEPHFKNRLAISLKHREAFVYTSGNKTPMFRTWLDS